MSTFHPSVATNDISMATYDPNILTADLFLQFQVVHPWITPTEEELQMSYLITLGLVETIYDPIVDRIKMVLAGATTIKRDRVVNELVFF